MAACRLVFSSSRIAWPSMSAHLEPGVSQTLRRGHAHELVNARLLRGLGLLARRLRLGAVSRDLASDQPRQLQRRHARPRHDALAADPLRDRSEEHTSELQSLMRISYAVFCLKKK